MTRQPELAGEAPPRRPRWRVWLRRGIKVTLVMIVTLVALIGIAVALLYTDWGRNQVRKRVQSELDAKAAGEVHIGSLEGSLLSSFALRDVSITDREGRSAVSVDKIAVDYRLLSLPSKEVRIRELVIDGLKVGAYLDADGELNLTQLFAGDDSEDEQDESDDEGGSGSAWRIVVERVVVKGGVFLRRDATLLEELTELALQAEVRFEDGALDLALTGLTGNWNSRDLAIDVGGHVHLDSEETRLEDVHVALGDARVQIPEARFASSALERVQLEAHLPVRVARALAPELGLLADVDVSIDGARESPEQPFAAQLELSAGRAEIAGTVTLEEKEPRATAALAVEEADLSSVWQGLPATALTGNIDCEATGTSLPDLVGSATVALGGTVEQTEVDQLRVTGSIDDRVVVAKLSGKPEGGHFDAEAEVALEPEIVVRSGRVEFRHQRVQRLVQRFVDLSGAVELVARASGPIDSLHVSGKGTGRSWSAYGNTGREAVVDFDLVRSGEAADGKLVVDANGLASADTELGDLDVEATISGGGRRARVAVHSVGDKNAHEIDIEGVVTRGPSAVRAELERTRIATRGLAWRGGPATITLRNNQTLRVDGLHLRSTAGNIDVDGDFALRGASRGELEVNARDIHLPDIGRALQLAEPLRGTATVRGTLRLRGRRTQGQISLAADGAAYGRDVPATSGKLDLVLANRDLDATGTFATNNVGRATVHAAGSAPRNPLDFGSWARLDERALHSAKLDGRVTSLEALAHLHPELPRSGNARIIAEIGEGAATGTFEVDGQQLVHDRLDATGAVKITAQLDGRSLVARANASVRKHGGVSADATIDLPGLWTHPETWRRLDERAIAHANANANVPSVDWWAEQLDLADQPIGASAELSFDVEPQASSVVGHVVLEQPKGGPRTRAHATRTEAEIRLGERSGELAVRGSVAGREHLSATARVAAGWRDIVESPDGLALAQLDATADIRGLPLTAVHQAVSAEPPARKQTLRGNIDGRITARGPLGDPDVGAKIDTHDAVILGSRFRSLAANASYHHGAVAATIDGEQLRGGSLSLTAATNVLEPSDQARVMAGLEAVGLDLGFVDMVAPELSVAGKLDARFTVEGPRAKPTATGTATLRGGKISPGPPLYDLSDLSVRLDLGKTRLTAKGSGNSGRGKLDFDTRIDLSELAPTAVDLTVQAEALPIETTTMILAVDTKTRVHGKKRGSDWDLVADVDDTIVHLPSDESDELHDSSLPDDLVFVSSRAKQKKSTSRSAAVPAPASVVKLRVRAPETIELRGQQAGAIAGVNLRIEMRDELTMIGTARTQRGWVSLFGRRYELRRALVSFEETTVPVLDVELAHEFTAMTLFIDVTGTSEEPIVKFRAEPARYDESELLAFVLGASPDDPRPNEETAGGRAKGIASSMLANRMQDMVSDVVPIDVLRIDMSDEQATAEKLTVGKWLTRKLFLAYRHRFIVAPDENSGEATIEYRFWRRWLLEAFYGDRGVGGADVLWIKRY